MFLNVKVYVLSGGRGKMQILMQWIWSDVLESAFLFFNLFLSLFIWLHRVLVEAGGLLSRGT